MASGAVPMASRAVLGGLPFRAGTSPPFVVVIVIAAVLLALLALKSRRDHSRPTVDAAALTGHTGASRKD